MAKANLVLLSAAIAGATTLVGYVVVNLFLEGMGAFVDFLLVDPQYLLAGVLTLAPLLFVAGLAYAIPPAIRVAFARRRSGEPLGLGRRFVYGCLVLALGTVPLLPALFTAGVNLASKGHPAPAFGREMVQLWVTLALLASIVVICSFYLLRSSKRAILSAPHHRASRPALYLLTAALTSLAFYGYLRTATLVIYAQAPRGLGGGRPQLVRILVEPSVQERQETGGLRFGPEGFSEPIALVHQGSETLTFQSPSNRRTFIVRKDTLVLLEVMASNLWTYTVAPASPGASDMVPTGSP